MSSKRWTIIWLTLTLLIFGCSDAELANFGEATPQSTVETAAALSSGATVAIHSAPIPASSIDVRESLEIPPQIPALDSRLPAAQVVPFQRRSQLPPLPGFNGVAELPAHFPGVSNVGSLFEPNEVLGPGRLGTGPGFPPESPGLELPGFEGMPGAELRRFQQPQTIPSPTNDHEAARLSASG